ncbi:MAG: hypothetical protein ACE37K_08875 [Planctomycetota bacterium]
MKRALMLLLVGSVVAPLVAQQTWLVRCGVGGPPVHFHDLPQAVAAAAPGDTIRFFIDDQAIAPCGPVFRFSPVVIDKPLTVVGARRGSPTVWLDSFFVRGVIKVKDIPAGERVVLRGMFLRGDDSATPGDRGLEITNCAGQVVLDRIDVHGEGFGDSLVRFTDCDDVVVHDCSFSMGRRPVEVVRSSVRFSNCIVYHEAGPPWPFPQAFFNSSPGIEIDHGRVSLDITTVRGASWVQSLGLIRTPAVYLNAGVLEVGPDARLYAGQPWPADSYDTEAMGLSEVYVDPRGYIQNLPQNPHPHPIPRDLHTTMYPAASPGETFDYGITGPPNGFGLMVLGAYELAPHPTPLGDVWLHPQALSVVACEPLDAEGWHIGALSVPAGVDSSFVYGLQSLLVGPSGALEVSRPTPLVLGWERTRSPYLP